MKQIYKYDNEMNYVPSENKIINDGEDIPKGYTDIPPVNPVGAGMYKPVFDKDKSEWRETATQEYIDSLQPPDPGPSEMEVLRKQVADLYYLIALGGS
ncbi:MULTISPECIES: hypothetical protein [Bacillus]|jgi:hypothetical protein|uniref:hypothetical protein n=1 Tax=Bacillus TaxID=1386 RepID=UPI00025A993A|nr:MULTISPECIES: hypothetical protein [Bacillus]AKQ72703.1 phage-like protein [Bacillus licheniformis WX-02]ARC71978.1 hypothetical protein B34_04641 [Bacillus licheniformis]AYC51195.1 hypothetical protein C7M53_07980 [Bacillus licheniformis]EQM28293.1 hypothetical protein N399_08980 [Bacillus licheniformis CG-B52]MCD2487992.1 hypothetical protein [Bacillus licheniformis]